MNRFKEALEIQSGACNPRAIAAALVRHMDEFYRSREFDGTMSIRRDPALRLITHQLAFLMGVMELESNNEEYAKAYKQCKEKAEV
jgi:hypothetical protein